MDILAKINRDSEIEIVRRFINSQTRNFADSKFSRDKEIDSFMLYGVTGIVFQCSNGHNYPIGDRVILGFIPHTERTGRHYQSSLYRCFRLKREGYGNYLSISDIVPKEIGQKEFRRFCEIENNWSRLLHETRRNYGLDILTLAENFSGLSIDANFDLLA